MAQCHFNQVVWLTAILIKWYGSESNNIQLNQRNIKENFHQPVQLTITSTMQEHCGKGERKHKQL